MITNSRPLTLEIYHDFTRQIGVEFFENNLYIDAYNEDDEGLMDSDYIIADLEINGKTYIMIHGFPGDNPIGVIFNDTEKHIVGEGLDEKVNEVKNWYRTASNNSSDFQQRFWYTRDRSD